MLWYDDVRGKGWGGVHEYIWATYNKLFECKFNDASLLE